MKMLVSGRACLICSPSVSPARPPPRIATSYMAAGRRSLLMLAWDLNPERRALLGVGLAEESLPARDQPRVDPELVENLRHGVVDDVGQRDGTVVEGGD